MRRFDLHVHTAAGSLDASIQPHDLVPEAASWGLDGILIAEHLAPWSQPAAPSARSSLLVMGLEVGFGRDHLLVMLSEGVTPSVARELKCAADPIALAEMVRARGDGIVVLAHPFRYASERWPGPDPVGAVAARELLSYVDAVEIVNGGCTDNENAMAGELARRLGLPITAGSDAHALEGVGYAFLELNYSVGDASGLIEQIMESRNEVHVRKNRRYVRWGQTGEQPTHPSSSPPQRRRPWLRTATA